MKRFSRIFEQRCIKWLIIATGILAAIAGIFVAIQPIYQSGGYNNYPHIELYDTWVLFIVLAKSALYCLLTFLIIVFTTNKSANCLFIPPLLMFIIGWNIFASSLPTEIVYSKSTATHRTLAYLDSGNRIPSKFSGKELVHSIIDNTTTGLNYECLVATKWWFGNFWLEKRNSFSETETYNVHDETIRKVNTEDSLFTQNCKPT